MNVIPIFRGVAMIINPKKASYTVEELVSLFRNMRADLYDGEACLDPGRTPGTPPRNILAADLVLSGISYHFRIAGDTKCKGVINFLRKVSEGGQVEFVLGPQGGIKIGVNGEAIETFQVYLNDEKQKLVLLSKLKEAKESEKAAAEAAETAKLEEQLNSLPPWIQRKLRKTR